jgi:hypothetical protein
MPKWVLEDDCLAPTAKMQINYTGPNPIKLFKEIKPMLLRIFEVSGKDVWERDFRWDTTEDPRSFFIRLYVDKALDQRSGLLIEIIFQGKQPSDPTKDGRMTVTLNGRLKTEFEMNRPIYRAAWWFYNKFFYGSVRRNYLKLCNEWLEKLWREFRAFLSMPNP